jgi:hypothetical protein
MSSPLIVKAQLKQAIARSSRVSTASGEMHRKVRSSVHVGSEIARCTVEHFGPDTVRRKRRREALVDRDQVHLEPADHVVGAADQLRPAEDGRRMR